MIIKNNLFRSVFTHKKQNGNYFVYLLKNIAKNHLRIKNREVVTYFEILLLTNSKFAVKRPFLVVH